MSMGSIPAADAASIPTGGPTRRLSAKPLCPMPSTCAAVGQCLYPQNACLTASTAANDVPDVARELVFEEMVEREDGWCDWVHPLPGYLMKCCDCGLVHEVEVAVARPVETLPDGSYTWEDVQTPEARVMWRMRRKATTANSVGMSEANAPSIPPVKTGEG